MTPARAPILFRDLLLQGASDGHALIPQLPDTVSKKSVKDDQHVSVCCNGHHERVLLHKLPAGIVNAASQKEKYDH